MAGLFSNRGGLAVETLGPLGPYAPLLDPRPAGPALLACFEEHCVDSVYGRDLPDSSFKHSPFIAPLCELPQDLARPAVDEILSCVARWAQRS